MDSELAAQQASLDTTSQSYLGQWNGLISTTNWEKGRIIVEWRNALIASGATAPEYSDEAWSRYVGNVSSQHVGRLRRVHERFAEVRADYDGLYWSHFQAALDWHDAEMWLEGAVQNNWSVSQMRNQRWEATGSIPIDAPHPSDIVASEWDEDATAAGDVADVETVAGATVEEVRDTSDSPRAEIDPGFESTDVTTGDDDDQPADESAASVPFEIEAAAPVRPFAGLPDLPDDVAESLEQFKLALLRHKVEGWVELSRDDALACLDALRQLVLAP